MKPIVVANWKMYFDEQEAIDTAKKIEELTKNVQIQIIICPNFLVLPAMKKTLEGSQIKLGAQNCSFKTEGALTGEISPKVLKDYCDFVILGHSERRDYLSEINSMISQKIKTALSVDLAPIVCLGEQLEEYDRKDQTRILAEVESAFQNLPKEQATKIILAYEPVWAISSEFHGKAKMTCGYASQIVARIRKKLEQILDKETSDEIQIIYGGSVSKENIEELGCEEFGGFLVGSASRNPEEFAEICKAAAK